MNKLAIKQIRSAVGRRYDQHRTLAALGLNKVNDVVVHNDTPQIRGMIKKIIHLLEIKEYHETE